MKKRTCIIVQVILFIWSFLSMPGVYFGDQCLVTQSFQDEWIFLAIYLLAFILFLVKEKIGKWIMIGWLSMWFITQFLSHEWYTIFKGGFMGSLEGKIEYFSGTIQWVNVEGMYIPDVFHTILHILILVALIVTCIYCSKRKSISRV